MKEFRDKVAVITGAASGIGRALAEHCVHEGMKVVLADIDHAALGETEQSLKGSGAKLLAVRTDVSKFEDIECLAQRTLDVFGAVHLLFNNAGVDARTTLWEATLADWQWVMGVNLWGVIHGIRTFVPIMLRQGEDCHIVNTSSIAGLITGPGIGVYKVTKHGVVSLSETLACELAAIDANTKIMDAERNRPRELENAAAYETAHPATIEIRETLRQLVEAGLPPSEVAARVFDAIRNEKFYILTHADWKPLVQKRMEDILQERNPDEAQVGPLKG